MHRTACDNKTKIKPKIAAKDNVSPGKFVAGTALELIRKFTSTTHSQAEEMRREQTSGAKSGKAKQKRREKRMGGPRRRFFRKAAAGSGLTIFCCCFGTSLGDPPPSRLGLGFRIFSGHVFSSVLCCFYLLYFAAFLTSLCVSFVFPWTSKPQGKCRYVLGGHSNP